MLSGKSDAHQSMATGRPMEDAGMSDYPTRSVPVSSVSRLSWLQGVWIGEDADRYMEEHWSTPKCNGLMGMFRLIQGGSPRFFELMTIDVGQGELVLRVKHFDPGLAGWEEKAESVEFSLVQLDGQKAVFFQRASSDLTWMVYHREGEALSVHFENEGGERLGSRFVFSRRA